MNPEEKEKPEDKHPNITPKSGSIDTKKTSSGKSQMFIILL